ncbi:hypothetical protein [Rhodococcus sp. LB1]|uniref:hypothetical protein n=1 Tax=Rhodococcus sp. LB1 TaxID=1807499 RepID=UPI00077A63B2|nr:hypothetical protein [Rhodococcus sp. LB1]KXX54126.1 hypothetical protein AZG88_25475 [Rhodococcus sp. LB1]
MTRGETQMVAPTNTAKRSGKPSAHSRVGMQVRLVPRGPAPTSPWVQITMVVPSRTRVCWMVSHFDGAVDIWPVHPTNAVYQFRSPTSHPSASE